jgi:hypothetical protein
MIASSENSHPSLRSMLIQNPPATQDDSTRRDGVFEARGTIFTNWNYRGHTHSRPLSPFIYRLKDRPRDRYPNYFANSSAVLPKHERAMRRPPLSYNGRSICTRCTPLLTVVKLRKATI